MTIKIGNGKERKRLTWHRDHNAKPYARERCAAILKIAEGQTPHAVARAGLLKPRDPDTVYHWLTVYETDGLEGLLAHPQGGYRGSSLVDKRAEVEERLRQPPTAAVSSSSVASPAVGPWRYRRQEVRASFEWLTDYSLSGVWRGLDRLGIGWKRSYINYWSPDPQYRPKQL